MAVSLSAAGPQMSTHPAGDRGDGCDVDCSGVGSGAGRSVPSAGGCGPWSVAGFLLIAASSGSAVPSGGR